MARGPKSYQAPTLEAKWWILLFGRVGGGGPKLEFDTI